MIPDTFYVARRTEEYPGTFTLHIQKPGNEPLAPFEPGQFNMLYSFGGAEVPISMSGAVNHESAYVHTIRTLGHATQGLERLREGDQLGVRGPFGRGWPIHISAAKTVLVIAGGLGLAPLRPLLYRLLEPGSGAKQVHLFYGARQPAEQLYARELKGWEARINVHTSVDSASADWQGNVGVITNLLSPMVLDPQETVAFVCGPEIMMRFTLQLLLKKNLPTSAIYLSMERNMKCATGQCGHCQWGPKFICKDGPVFCYQDIEPWFHRKEV